MGYLVPDKSFEDLQRIRRRKMAQRFQDRIAMVDQEAHEKRDKLLEGVIESLAENREKISLKKQLIRVEIKARLDVLEQISNLSDDERREKLDLVDLVGELNAEIEALLSPSQIEVTIVEAMGQEQE